MLSFDSAAAMRPSKSPILPAVVVAILCLCCTHGTALPHFTRHSSEREVSVVFSRVPFSEATLFSDVVVHPMRLQHQVWMCVQPEDNERHLEERFLRYHEAARGRQRHVVPDDAMAALRAELGGTCYTIHPKAKNTFQLCWESSLKLECPGPSGDNGILLHIDSAPPLYGYSDRGAFISLVFAGGFFCEGTSGEQRSAEMRVYCSVDAGKEERTILEREMVGTCRDLFHFYTPAACEVPGLEEPSMHSRVVCYSA